MAAVSLKTFRLFKFKTLPRFENTRTSPNFILQFVYSEQFTLNCNSLMHDSDLSYMYICTNYDGMAFFEPLSSFFRSNYLSRDYVSVENFCIVLKSFELESKKRNCVIRMTSTARMEKKLNWTWIKSLPSFAENAM